MALSSKFNIKDTNNLDRQIEQLYRCEQLSEADIRNLCEKVVFSSIANTHISYHLTLFDTT